MSTIFKASVGVLVAGLISIAGTSAQVGRQLNLLDANTVSDKELTALPNMTPALAKAIVDRRPFASAKELDAVLKGITPQLRAELYGRLFIAINLNTAPRDEILLIPGVGERMAHEFEDTVLTRRSPSFGRRLGSTSIRRKSPGWNNTSSSPSI